MAPIARSLLACLASLLLLGLASPPAHAQSLANGGSVAGSISPVGDEDTWTFSAAAGENFQVRVTDVAVGALHLRLRLFDPTGALVKTAQGATVAEVVHTATSAGTWSVVVDDVSGGGGTTGAYAIDYVGAPGANEHGALATPGSVAGSIDLGDIDSYTFTAAAGEQYEVRIADVAFSALYPRLSIYGPDGGLVHAASSATVVKLSGAAPVTGTYTVVLTDISSGLSATGDYELFFVRYPDADELGPLEDGGSVSNSIGLGDIDTWTFSIEAGERFELRAADSGVTALDPLMRLFDPFGGLVTSTSSATVVSLVGTAAYTGTYTVALTDTGSGLTGTGAYDLHFVRLPGANEHGPLFNGGAVAETIDLGDIDSWTFDVSAGQNYRIRVADVAVTSLHPLVRLYAPNGAEVTSKSSATVVELTGVATVTGTYSLTVTDASSGLAGSGDYEVHLVRTPDANELGALANGDSVSAGLSLGDLDSWSFDMVGGESFQLRVVDTAVSALYPLAVVYDPFGGFVASASSATVVSLTGSAAYTGTYTLVVTDVSSGLAATGAYDVHFVRLPGANEGGILIDGATVNGTLTLGDLDSYTFNAVGGETALVTLTDTTTSGLHPQVDLYGPLGQYVTSANGATVATLSYTVAMDGIHTLVVRDVSSGLAATGPYSIAVEGSGAPPQLVPNTLLPPQFASDPLLLDVGGNPAFGPRVGDPTEPFNFALDCSGADAPSVWLMQCLSSTLSTPIATEWGFLYIAGAPVLTTAGLHSQNLVAWFPFPAGLTVPNDPVLVGLNYTTQGWVGGFGASGRLSNAIEQVIGG